MAISAEAAIRKAGGLTGPLEDATELALDELRGVASLEPLRRARRLAELTLGAGPLPDLAPLARLPALRALRIENVTLADPAGLRGLRKLEELTLGGLARGRYVAIPDGARWPPLPSVRALSLLSRTATRLSFLASFPGLEALYCAGNRKLRSLAGLERCSKLRVLVAWSTSVADLAPAEGLPLRRVALAGTKVKTLAPLAGSPVENLVASTTPLRSLEGLEDCRGLVELDAGKCDRLADLSALRGHPRLRCLNVSDAPAKDFGALAGLPGLEALALGRTSFDDLALLLELPALKEVYLADTPLEARRPGVARLRTLLRERGGDVHDGPFMPAWKTWKAPALHEWMRV